MHVVHLCVAALTLCTTSLGCRVAEQGRAGQGRAGQGHLERVGLGLERAQAHGLLAVGAPAIVVGLEDRLVQEQAQLGRHGR